MHRKLLLFLFCIFSTLLFLQAQPVDSATMASRQKQYNFYWEKHKKRARTGWILLGTGLAASVGGLFLIGDGISDYPSVDLPPGVSIAIGVYGIGATIASVPFFIGAGDNKRKARLALKGERVSLGQDYLPRANYAALSITLPL